MCEEELPFLLLFVLPEGEEEYFTYKCLLERKPKTQIRGRKNSKKGGRNLEAIRLG